MGESAAGHEGAGKASDKRQEKAKVLPYPRRHYQVTSVARGQSESRRAKRHTKGTPREVSKPVIHKLVRPRYIGLCQQLRKEQS